MADNRVQVILTAVDQRFSAVLARGREALNRFGQGAEATQTAVSGIGTAWAGVAAAIGGMSLVTAGVRQYAAFDDSMRRVGALANATEADFARLTDKAKELGATTRYSASEAALGLAQLAAAGQTSEQMLASIGPALDMAAAGGASLETTADQLTNIMSQFGLEAEKAGHVADVLTVGFTGAATTMDELAIAMSYTGPVAKSVGYSLESTTAILQTLANAGYKADRAGTALRGGMSRLLNPTRRARDILEKYSIQVYDSTGAMRPFADIIEDVGKSGMTTAEQLKLFGAEAGPGMMALVSQGADAIRQYEEKLQNVDGRAHEMAEKMEAGIGGAMRRFKAAAEAIAISFGETFGPALAKAIDALALLFGWIADLPGPIKVLIGAGAALVTALVLWNAGLKTLAANLMTSAGQVANLGRSMVTAVRTGGPAFIAGMRGAAASVAATGAAAGTAAPAVTRLGLAARAASVSVRALSAAGTLWLAWDVGKAVGGWLNQFGFMRKGMLSLIYAMDRVRLAAQKMWAVLTGGDVKAVDAQIDAARKSYEEGLKEIESGADLKRMEAEKARREGGEDGGAERVPPLRPDGQDRPDKDDESGDENAEEAAVEDEVEDEAEDKPDRTKPRRRRNAPDTPDDDAEEKPAWQLIYDEVHAGEKAAEEEKRALGEARRKENDEADAERAGKRLQVWDKATDTWRYEYGVSDEDARERYEERDGRLYEKPAAGLAEGLSRAVDAGLDKLGADLGVTVDRALQSDLSPVVRASATLPREPDGVGAEREPRPQPRRPDKVVELKLGDARLQGAETDVESFLRQLEQAGLTA